MKNKRRRIFKGYIGHRMVCHGVFYDQWNIQVLYRKDVGWAGEQYNSIHYVFDLMPGLNKVNIAKNINILDRLMMFFYDIRRKLK